MALKPRVIIRKTLYIACIVYAVIYLMSCFTGFISPISFFPLTFLALGFVYLTIGMLFVTLLSVFLDWKRCWIFLLIFFAGYKNINSVFAFHDRKKFDFHKKENVLRILSWNVNYFGDCQLKFDSSESIPRRMFAFIKKSNADILCFQDFSNFNAKWFRNNKNYIIDSLHYPYSYFPIDYTYNESWAPEQYGLCIFSRIPLSDTGRIRFKRENPLPESFCFATIHFNGAPIKIFNAHLSSMTIHGQTASPRAYNFFKADTGIILHSNTFRKLMRFDKIHTEQMEIIKHEMDLTNTSYIFCGDLNAVPSSYVYQQLSKGLDDAFLNTGFGFGGTYDSISPVLRIDVVLTEKRLQSVQHLTPHLHLSDHYPNLVDIMFK